MLVQWDIHRLYWVYKVDYVRTENDRLVIVKKKILFILANTKKNLFRYENVKNSVRLGSNFTSKRLYQYVRFEDNASPVTVVHKEN